VGGDVAPGAHAGVPRHAREQVARWRQRPAPPVEPGHLARGDPHERHEVVAAPDAGREGVGEPSASAQQGTPEARAVHADRGPHRGGRRPEAAHPVSLDDLEPALAQAAQQQTGHEASEHASVMVRATPHLG
jgi:hypothetical protein